MAPSRTSNGLPEVLIGHLGYLGVVFGNRAHMLFRDQIAGIGLRPADFDYLATVSERGPLSQRELAEILNIAAARVVAATDDLEARGLVRRAVAEHDRRRNEITLTAAGRTLLRRGLRIAAEVETTLVERLGSGERDLLRQLLQRSLDLDRPDT